jgi:hypothetical protein
MTSITVAPVYVLIDYAFAVLNANDPNTWNRANYDGLLPIVPLNEEPELTEFDGPRVIYEYSLNDTGTTPFRGRGSVTFAVRDNNYRRLTRAMNIMGESFGRLDETAADINDWADRLKDRPVDPVDFDISFGYVRQAFAESGTPAEEEEGPMVGIVSIAFDYFVEYDINTRPSV